MATSVPTPPRVHAPVRPADGQTWATAAEEAPVTATAPGPGGSGTTVTAVVAAGAPAPSQAPAPATQAVPTTGRDTRLPVGLPNTGADVLVLLVVAVVVLALGAALIALTRTPAPRRTP